MASSCSMHAASWTCMFEVNLKRPWHQWQLNKAAWDKIKLQMSKPIISTAACAQRGTDGEINPLQRDN